MTPLHELSDALGIELTKPTTGGPNAPVADETLLALCRVLGADVAVPEDAPAALAELRRARLHRRCEPVSVAWDDRVPELTFYRVAEHVDEPFDVALALDTGATYAWSRRDCPIASVADAGDGWRALTIALPQRLPHGAHRANVTDAHGEASATVLASPRRIARPPRPAWGLFAPLYALHDAVRPELGDLGTLRRFANWSASHGAAVVGTLPLLATFVGHGDEPCDPSPYAPVSRCYWNEVYLDCAALLPERVPGPVSGAYVDLPGTAARLRAALEPIAVAAERDPELRAWLARRPDISEYARFRSKVEGMGERGARYHEFVQWQIDRQLGALRDDLDARGQALYLDFPIGTHPAGFDVTREPEEFAPGASVGAPPDAFHSGGQTWGFPAPEPRAARANGYATLRAALDAHLRFARVLRIDHVMGLHRLWLIPEGAEPADGAYVRYAAEEQWAAVCLAAAGYGAQIVGEDLGTVPLATRAALAAHGALGMWVLQFETAGAPSADQLACTGTHDLPTFATWWDTLDAKRRSELLDAFRPGAATDAGTALSGCLGWLGASDAPLVIAALEDLWLETEPQNRPGIPAATNFSHRATYPIDALDTVPGLTDRLAALDTARRNRPL